MTPTQNQSPGPEPEQDEAGLQTGHSATGADGASSADIPGPVLQLINTTQELTALLRRETALLEEGRTQAASELHDEKSRLATEYRKTIGALKVQKHLLGPPESEIRRQIEKINEGFRTELKRHAKTVVRLKTVTEGIIKSIGDEVAKKDAPVGQYGKNAAIQGKGRQPTSISVNAVV